MKNFMKGGGMKALTWLELIFDDAKGGGGGWRGKSATARQQVCFVGRGILVSLNCSSEGT